MVLPVEVPEEDLPYTQEQNSDSRALNPSLPPQQFLGQILDKATGMEKAQGDEVTPTDSPIDALAGGIGSSVGRAIAPAVERGGTGLLADEVGALKIQLKNGLIARVEKNPTPAQAKNIFGRSKSSVVRYFADPDGNLHMWDAYDLPHENVMDALGVEMTPDNYAGAGVVNSPQEAADIAHRFLKAPKNKPKKMAEGGMVQAGSEVPVDDLPVNAPVLGSEVPAEDIPVDHSGFIEGAKTAVEQGLSGLTLGASKVAQTKLGISTPEDIAGREEAHPIVSTLANIGGTGTLFGLTGGLGPLAEGTGMAGRIAVGALEGAGIGGINQVTDDWSQDKSLDAQKIVASAGLGALLGGAGAGVIEGIKAKFSPLIKKTSPLDTIETSNPFAPENAAPSVPSENMVQVEPPPPKPPVSSIDEAAERLENAQKSGINLDRPQAQAVKDALSRVDLGEFNPPQMQIDALGNPDQANAWNLGREMSGKTGDTVRGIESGQKQTAIQQLDKTIADLSPKNGVVSDAKSGGNRSNEILANRYKQVQEATKPALQALKDAGIDADDHLQGAVQALISGKNNNLANMFDTSGADIAVKPFNDKMLINRDTYNSVKTLVSNLQDGETTLPELMHYRSVMGDSLENTTAGGQKSISEIGALKAKLLSYIEDYTQKIAPDLNIRAPLRDWAINEGYREAIEHMGASVGKKQVGVASKIVPEVINDNIMSNSSTVQTIKNFLNNPKDFNEIMGNYLAEQRAKATTDNALSSNKFGSLIRNNKDAIGSALDAPYFQKINDLTTIMRNLGDAKSINPSGSAKTVMGLLKKSFSIDYVKTLEEWGEFAKEKMADRRSIQKFNAALSAQKDQNTAARALQKKSMMTNDQINSGINTLFKGFSSESRKVNDGK